MTNKLSKQFPKREFPKRGPGRPWTEDGRRTIIAVRVSDRERDLLKLAAKTDKVAMSTMIRLNAIAAAKRSISRLD